MTSGWIVAAEIAITFAVCAGFAVRELRILKRLKAERERAEREAADRR